MGRKGSRLIPFLKKGIKDKKYVNLKFKDERRLIFSLFLPHKTVRMGVEYQLILQDWYQVKNKIYRMDIDYSPGKQAFVAALRRSDFLECVDSSSENELVYRILADREVEDKKLRKPKTVGKPKKGRQRLSSTLSVDTGASDSGIDSPGNAYDLLQGVLHDHTFGRSSPLSEHQESLNCVIADDDNVFTHNSPEDYNVGVPDAVGKISSQSSQKGVEPRDLSKFSFDDSSTYQFKNVTPSLFSNLYLDFETDPNSVDIGIKNDPVPLEDLFEMSNECFTLIKKAFTFPQIYCCENIVDTGFGQQILVFKAKKEFSDLFHTNSNEQGLKSLVMDEDTFKLFSMSDYKLQEINEDEIWLSVKQKFY